MIELKTMSEEERTLITIQCDSFFLDYEEIPAYKEVWSFLRRRYSYKYTKEIWTVIYAFRKALSYNIRGSTIPLDKNSYTKANSVHEKGVSFSRMKRLLSLLEADGYIKLYKGFKDLTDGTAISTCMLLTDKYLRLVEGIPVKDRYVSPDFSGLVELRDPYTKLPITDPCKLEGSNLLEEGLSSYNKHISTFDIRVKGRKALTVYKRVFSGDFNSLGRYFSKGRFQTTKKVLRSQITINGKQTTELDYSSIHLSMLYCECGIVLDNDFDPYQVKIKALDGADPKQLRSLCKRAVMCLLNSSSRGEAIQAVRYHYLLDKKKPIDSQEYSSVILEGKGCYSNLFDAIEDHNSRVSHFFYTERLWAYLQGLDSKIATYILKVFTEAGKVALPWHDSFVVCREDRDFLHETMVDAWHEVLGTYDNCKVEVEF